MQVTSTKTSKAGGRRSAITLDVCLSSRGLGYVSHGSSRPCVAPGNVINALTDKKVSHVPYRDSKLTRVLQAFGFHQTQPTISIHPGCTILENLP